MQFRRPGRPRVGIDIAPLVDVVFLLVIFFAVSTTFLESSGIRLELPESSSGAERESDELAVYLGRGGELSLNGRELTADELREALPRELDERDSKVVVLRADTGVSHGAVVRVMDLVKTAGAEGLTIATRPEDEDEGEGGG